jgi:hypothetical protein
MQLEFTLTCPACSHQAAETMPTDACQFFYDCKGCGIRLKPYLGRLSWRLLSSKVTSQDQWASLSMSVDQGILLQKSKVASGEIFGQIPKREAIADSYVLSRLTEPPMILTRGDEVPQISTRKTHQRPSEFLTPCAKRLLQQNPGWIGSRVSGTRGPILTPNRHHLNNRVLPRADAANLVRPWQALESRHSSEIAPLG